MIQTSIHLNLNIMAGVCIETTGPLVGFHDLYRICIIPVDNFFVPAKGVIPFLVSFQPIHEEHPWLSKDDYAKAKAVGVHPGMAGEILSMWAKRLPKQKDKKLVPISANWVFESAFMKALFGSDVFDEVFFEVGRDLTTAAAYINDSCNLKVEDIPFGRYTLGPICNKVNVQIDEPRDALNLCRATINAYYALLKRTYKGVSL